MNAPFAHKFASAVQAHLRLGRVSNLPTVWSDCVAGWALADGVFEPSLLIMVAAVSLIYCGGMYLNDACDAEFDAAFRPERPIPRGEATVQQAYVIACVLLALGLILAAGEGLSVAAFAALLVGLVIFYDLIHKRISWSPLIMGGCRALIYLTVGCAGRGATGFNWLTLGLWALALGAYVIGFSYVAKVEESDALKRYGPLALVFAPPALFILQGLSIVRAFWCVLFLGWLSYCLAHVLSPKRRHFKTAVSGLIAGICLVDFLAVTQGAAGASLRWQIVVISCFAVAIILQKSVPAT